jgi:transcriptional regulator NrdR family protein
MRCTTCGAATRVIETRDVESRFVIRRRRECFNDHLFNSFEVDESLQGVVITMATRRNRIQAIERRIARWYRDQDIVRRARAGEKVLAIAVDLGMPESTVAHIIRKFGEV